MSLIMNYPQLARAVHEYILKNGVTPRSTLNSVFKTTSDDKKQEALSLVIRSLIAYGHLQRHFDSANSIVNFWITGQTSPFTPDEGSKAKTSDLEDWLNKPIRQGVDVAPKVTTPPVTKPYSGVPVPPKVVAHRVVAPSAMNEMTLVSQGVGGPPKSTDDEQAAMIATVVRHRARAEEVTADQFLIELAEELAFFTKSYALSILGRKYAKNVISMRFAHLQKNGRLFFGVNISTLEEVYWSPKNPCPSGHTASVHNNPNPEPRTRGPNKKPKVVPPQEEWPAVKTTPVPPADHPIEVVESKKEPFSVHKYINEDLPALHKACQAPHEPRVTFDSEQLLVLRRETGEDISFTESEQLALYKLLRHVNLHALYENLKVQLTQESQQ